MWKLSSNWQVQDVIFCDTSSDTLHVDTNMPTKLSIIVNLVSFTHSISFQVSLWRSADRSNDVLLKSMANRTHIKFDVCDIF